MKNVIFHAIGVKSIRSVFIQEIEVMGQNSENCVIFYVSKTMLIAITIQNHDASLVNIRALLAKLAQSWEGLMGPMKSTYCAQKSVVMAVNTVFLNTKDNTIFRIRAHMSTGINASIPIKARIHLRCEPN